METSYDGIERLSPSIACAAKTVFATFEILKKADGNLPSKEVMNQKKISRKKRYNKLPLSNSK